jgi:acyl-CoA thioester hydrolase
MSETRRLMTTVKFPVRWSDHDQNGHVNNAMYFTYFEQARIEWFHSISTHNRAGLGPVVASAACDYLRPISYPATLAITVECARPGRSSFTVYNTIFLDGEPAVKFAEGRFVMVWVDRSTGKSVPLPDSIRTLLTAG